MIETAVPTPVMPAFRGRAQQWWSVVTDRPGYSASLVSLRLLDVRVGFYFELILHGVNSLAGDAGRFLVLCFGGGSRAIPRTLLYKAAIC